MIALCVRPFPLTESQPECAFEVAGIVSDEPLPFYKKCQVQDGEEPKTFLHYFQGAATAHGILIGRTWQFGASNELKALASQKADSAHRSRIGMSGGRSWKS